MKSDSNLKIGLIGCGSLGLQHAKNIEQMKTAELVSVSSHRLSSAESLSREISSAPKAYDDHRKMMANNELDAVLVVTPNHTHSEIVNDAAEVGIHIFCEKPMALTLEDCDAMIKATDKAGVYLMIGYLRRFENKYRAMKQWVDEGKIGDVLMGHISLLYSRPQGNPNSWVNARDLYGGLYSFYSHELDQLTSMAGDIGAVQCMMKYGDLQSNEVEESISMNFEFKSGAIGSLNCCRVYPGGSSELGISGTKGTIKISDGILSYTPIDGEQQVLKHEYNNAYLAELEYFFDCIRHSTPPVPNGIDGRRTIAIAMAAHESARTGSKIKIYY